MGAIVRRESLKDMRLVRSNATARRPLPKAAMAAALLGGMAVMGGCAAETTAWPKMTDFSRINQKVLTPQEQEQAIQSMSAEQKAEQAKAIEKIEKGR
jgi:hypothetical protein